MLLSRRHRVGLSSLLPFCFEILPTVKMARRASKGLRRAAERATAVRSLLLTVRTAIHVEVSQALPVAILAPWPESAVGRASSWCRCVPTMHCGHTSVVWIVWMARKRQRVHCPAQIRRPSRDHRSMHTCVMRSADKVYCGPAGTPPLGWTAAPRTVHWPFRWRDTVVVSHG